MHKYHHILFPITYDCNLNCQFCSVKHLRGCKVEINKAFSDIIKADAEWVFITGGEPFLVPNLLQICDAIKKAGFKVGVTTNGTINNPDIANHVDRLGISIDGRKEYHDKYRGNGVYDKAIDLFNSINDKCETVIMTTLFEENKEEIKLMECEIEKLNPDYWQITKDINQKVVV